MILREHLKNALKALFPTSKTQRREVGFPARLPYPVSSQKQILELVAKSPHKSPKFVSVYSYPEIVVDKLFFDLDGASAYRDMKMLDAELHEQGVEHFVVFSGKKGFHVYVSLEPVLVNPQNMSSVVSSVLQAQNGIVAKLELESADPHVHGDLRRLTRIPGTYRYDTNSFCYVATNTQIEESVSFIDFLTTNVEDIDDFVAPCGAGSKVSLGKLVNEYEGYAFEIEETRSVEISNVALEQKQVAMLDFEEKTSREAVLRFFGRVMPKTLVKRISALNPDHQARVSATAFLLEAGLTEHEIVELFSYLRWLDFKQEITAYHVRKTREWLEKKHALKRMRKTG